MSIHPHEEAIVRTFVIAAKRERYVTLFGNAKRRRKALSALDHFHDLDPRYVTDVTARFDILPLLLSKGAPDSCHVIANIGEIDGRDMPLAEALSAAESGRWGTLIGCIPGQLAYFMGEDGGQRLVLQKKVQHQ